MSYTTMFALFAVGVLLPILFRYLKERRNLDKVSDREIYGKIMGKKEQPIIDVKPKRDLRNSQLVMNLIKLIAKAIIRLRYAREKFLAMVSSLPRFPKRKKKVVQPQVVHDMSIDLPLQQEAASGGVPPMNPPKDPPEGPSPERTEPNAKWVTARHVYGVILLFYFSLILVGYLNTTTSGPKWWVIAIVAMICHLVSSIKVISETDMAVSILFGTILEPLGSGPHLIPWPMRVTIATKNQIKVDFGTLDPEKNPEDRDLVERAKQSDSWFVEPQPVRINWGDISSVNLTLDQKKGYENSPLTKGAATDPHLYFTFKIWSLRSLIEEAGGLREAIDLIKDTCIASLQAEAGKTFLAKAIEEVDVISKKIRARVEELVWDPQAIKRAGAEGKNPGRSWGVDIIEVVIKDVGTGKTINQALADRTAAISQADGARTAAFLKAEGERTRLTEEGQGRAAAMTVEAEAERIRLEKVGLGQAAALGAVAKVAGTKNGAQVLKLRTLEEVGKGGKAVILPIDMSLLTSVIGAGVSLEATKTAGSENQKGNQ